MSESIQPHPEFQALLDELRLLREELAGLLTEEHDLLNIVKPNLLALYQKKIGAWEVQALQAEIAARRTKRKLELAQAAVNQGSRPAWNEIEATLELEFLAWQQRLREAMEQLTAAEERMKHLISPAADRELKTLYYALVKKLHPDLNPELGDESQRLWHRVQDAYEHADVEELRALAILANQTAPDAATPRALETLRRDRDTLQQRIAALEKRIEQIESQPPFPLREKLADEEWVAGRRQEIETKNAQWEAQRMALDAALQVLLKSTSDGKEFGSN